MERISKLTAAIDANFGDGYAKQHPELVAALEQSAAVRYLADHVRDSACSVESGLESVAAALTAT